MDGLILLLKEVKPEYDWENNDHIASRGDVDSYELMQIVVKINEKYNINVPVEELNADNFESIYTMQNMIKRVAGEK